MEPTKKEDGTAMTIAELRETIALLDLVLAHLREGVCLLSDDLRIFLANDDLARVAEKERIFLLGQHLWDVLMFTDADRDTLRKRLERLLAEGGEYTEKFTLGSGESKRILEIVVAPIMRVKKLIVVLRDVTERERWEREMCAHTEELKQFNQMMIGRELRMSELKNEIARLEGELSILQEKTPMDASR